MTFVSVVLEGFTCTVDYFVNSDQTAMYVARIYKVSDNYWELLLSKSFGNGVAAEDWLLDTVEYPSFVHLQAK